MAQEIIDLVIKADGSAAIASIKAVEGALSKLNSAQAGINQGVNKASAISSQAVSPSGQSKSNPQANFQNASQQVSSAARAATSAAQGIDKQTRALQNMNRELATAERNLSRYQDRLQKLRTVASAPASEQRALSKQLLGPGARPSMWSPEGIERAAASVDRQTNVVNSKSARRDSQVQSMAWSVESSRRQFERADQKAANDLAKNDEKQAERARKLREQRDKEEAKVADQRARNDVKTSQQAQLTQERNARSRARYDEMYRGGSPTDRMMSEANRMNREFDSRRTQRNAYAAERSANQNMYAERRSNTDLAIAGAILGAGGYAALQVPKYGVSQYDQYRKTMIGVQSIEGANAGQVVNQARSDASNMYGAGYRDVLNQQMLLRQSGQTTEQSRSSVLAMADINAATGGNADRLQRNIYNLSQVEQQGKLTGRDLRDFAVNLVPIREALAKQMGVSNAEVAKKVSAGEVSSDMVREALIAIAQDPRFKGRSAAISESTVGGQWEKTQEEIQKTGELVGESLTPALIGANKVLRSIAVFMANNPSLTKGLGWTAGAVGVAGVTAGGLSGGRAAMGMLGQAMPGLQKLPGVGGLFGEFGMKANTSATVANTMALNANTAAVAGGGAAGAADDLLGMGGGGKAVSRIGPMVAGLLGSPVIIAAAVALAVGAGVALYQHLKNKKDDEKPENDPDAPNEIPGDPRVPGKLKGNAQAKYQRDAAAQAHKEFQDSLSQLYNEDTAEGLDPNDPASWDKAIKYAGAHDKKVLEEARGHWARRGTALKQARKAEGYSTVAAPLVADPPNTDFMNWSRSGGSTAQTPAGAGSSASGGTGIKNIKENSDGSREVLLLLPPDQMSRDVRQATRRR